MKKIQEDIKRQVDKERKKSKVWKKGDRVILSMKDLMFKKRLVKKLVDWYIGSYIIKEVISTNTAKLWLSILIRIYLIVNISWVV